MLYALGMVMWAVWTAESRYLWWVFTSCRNKRLQFVVNEMSSGDNHSYPSSLLQLRLFFCSEADKVPVEGLAIKDKGIGNEKESESGKKHGDGPSPTTASPTTQPAAVTQ